MSVTSDEVNYLIYRYLQESGFTHSSFAFGHESHILKNDFKNVKVLPGALIQLLQKGLLYLEAETHINEDGTEKECTRPFSLLQPHECERGRKNKKDELLRKKEKEKKRKAKEEGKFSLLMLENRMEIDAEAEMPAPTKKSSSAIPSSDVLFLQGHTSEVFKCSWNPFQPLLATGSADSTARIWKIPTGPLKSDSNYPEPIILKHYEGETSKDVTAIRWSPSGHNLATGSYGGDICLWTENGELLYKLNEHKGPVFSLKWNSTEKMLLSGGIDNRVIAWDGENGSIIQQFKLHQEIDWKNDEVFASCSTDKTIKVCQIGSEEELKTFVGHTHEINEIEWCPQGQLLASCSDDTTAKIWTMDQDSYIADFRGHDKEIYTLTWSPTGPGSENPNEDLLLATASFDHTIKLWDIETQNCIMDLTRHKQSVYSIEFSPNGKYLASGSYDGRIIIWNVHDGSVIRHFKQGSGIFDVAWNPEGDKVAATFAQNTACVFDFRM